MIEPADDQVLRIAFRTDIPSLRAILRFKRYGRNRLKITSEEMIENRNFVISELNHNVE